MNLIFHWKQKKKKKKTDLKNTLHHLWIMNPTKRAEKNVYSHQTVFHWQMQLCEQKVKSQLRFFKDYTLAKD